MGGRLDFTAKFRDLQVMEDIKKKSELGWLEEEFTVYGVAYLERGEMCYKVSSDPSKIWQFADDAASDGIFCGAVMQEMRKCAVPLGMREDISTEVKKQLACKLYQTYPRQLFVLLEQIAASIRDDTAYEWLLREKEKLEGSFDERKLRYFRRLIGHFYALQRLSELHRHELLQWLDAEEKCIEDNFALKDIFEKTFYGLACYDGNVCRYFEDCVPEFIYRKKNELEEKGVFTGPVLRETLWYNYNYTLKDCRRSFAALLRENTGSTFLQTAAELCGRKKILRDAALRDAARELNAPSQAVLRLYLQKWQVTLEA